MNTNNMPTMWNRGFGAQSELRREIDRLFDDFLTAPVSRGWKNPELEWAPDCDVEEGQDHFLLTLDMPGVQKDQIKLEVVNNQLTISGEKRHDEKKKTDGLWLSERRYGKFSRTFTLQSGVDAEKIEASYQDGTLRVYVPKSETAKPRQIKISNSSGTGFLGRLIGQSSAHGEEKAAS